MGPDDGKRYDAIEHINPHDAAKCVEMTYTAVARREKIYRGKCEQKGTKTWKLRPKEYIVGAIFAVTLRLSRTVKNFPKLPTGWSMASSSPPTFPFSYP